MSDDAPRPAQTLLAALGDRAPAGATAEGLDAALADAIVEARAAHPNVSLSDEAFVAHLARHLDERRPTLAEAVRACRAPDLFLACACAHGDEHALQTFEAIYGAELTRILSRSRASVGVDDARQIAREKLFVGARPKIAEYSGRGDLRTWLRVSISRLVVNLATRGPRDVPGDRDDELFDRLPASDADVEIEQLKQRYLPQIRAFFAPAFAALDPRARTFLRQRYVDDLSIDQIAALYGMHRATVARKLAQARTAIFDDVRARVRRELELSEGETESLLRLVQSRLEITLAESMGGRGEE